MYNKIYQNATLVCVLQIYIPIKGSGGSWYLLIIAVCGRKIYHIDSNLTDDVIEERMTTIKKIVSHDSLKSSVSLFFPSYDVLLITCIIHAHSVL